MCNSYFFLRKRGKWWAVCYFLPVAVLSLYLLFAAMGLTPATDATYRMLRWVVSLVFLYYVGRLIGVQWKIRRSIRQVDEGTYSNSDDFPVRYARRIEWVPISICILMFVCFLLNDIHVKMCRDLFFTVVNVWFLMYTLHPHCKGIEREDTREEELDMILIGEKDSSTHKLSDKRCKQMETMLMNLIKKEQLFLDNHLTVEQLSRGIGSNRNYVSEVIARSEYRSFYTLINSLRLEHAEMLLRQQSPVKIEHVAFDSGFSSINVFSQVFKRYRGVSPTAFIKALPVDKIHPN